MSKKITPRPRVTVWDVAEAIVGNRAQLGKLLRQYGDTAVIQATYASLEHVAEDQAAYFVAVVRGDAVPAKQRVAHQVKDLRRKAMACVNGDSVAGMELMATAQEMNVSTSGRGAFEIADEIEKRLREAT